MKLLFPKNDKPTIGVEIELQILDPSSFDLIPAAEQVLEICRKRKIDRIKAEIHQSMLEIDTEISSDVAQCREFLEYRLGELYEIAESLELKIGITGTHPFQQWSERLISRNNRYQFLHQKFQWLARRMNVYGLHVHVGMPSGNHALAISQAMTYYLPHLLALSANSPFWQGIDTGMQSSRISIMESFPFAGPPPRFSDWEEFEYYFKTFYRTGVIQSMKDLYWHIRPNIAYGTIEYRICDGMSTLSDTMALVALIHCLTVSIQEKFDGDPNSVSIPIEYSWIAPHNLWIAARDGLDGIIITDLKGNKKKISDEILDLIQSLTPISKQLNCFEELNTLRDILTHGNGAQRQRSGHLRGISFPEIVSDASQRLFAGLGTKT